MPSRRSISSCLLLGLLVLGTGVAAWGQSPCRERAQRLAAAARRCRERIASGEIQSCTITLSFRNDQQVSVEQAEALAASFNRNADRYDSITKQMEGVRGKIRLDQRAITMHGFAKREQDFEDWANLSAGAQKEFEASVMAGLLDTAIFGAQKGAAKLATFNTSKVNKGIKEMKALGIDDPLLFETLQAYGRAKDKKQQAKAFGEALERLKKMKDAHGMASDRDMLKATATVLGWLVEDPKLGFLITEVDIAIAALYNNAVRRVALGEVERLTKLTEEELKAIKRVAEVMKEHVRQLNDLKAQLRLVPVCT